MIDFVYMWKQKTASKTMFVSDNISHTAFPKTRQLIAIIFETSKRIGQSPTFSLIWESVGRERVTRACRYLSSHHGERQAKAKVNVRIHSVPLGGEDTTDSVPSKGVSFRVVSGASVTTSVRFSTCPFYVSLFTTSRHVTQRDALDTLQYSSRPSRTTLTGWVRDGCQTRGTILDGLVVGSLRTGQSLNLRSGGRTKLPKTPRMQEARRKSSHWLAQTWSMSWEEKIWCSYNGVISRIFDTEGGNVNIATLFETLAWRMDVKKINRCWK